MVKNMQLGRASNEFKGNFAVNANETDSQLLLEGVDRLSRCRLSLSCHETLTLTQ